MSDQELGKPQLEREKIVSRHQRHDDTDVAIIHKHFKAAIIKMLQ